MKFFIVFAALIAVSFASLGQDINPALAAISPTTEGLDAGLQQGAGNLKAAVQNAGAAVNQAADGAADLVADGAAGFGQTVGQVPGRVYQTLKALDNGNNIISSLLGAVFGH